MAGKATSGEKPSNKRRYPGIGTLRERLAQNAPGALSTLTAIYKDKKAPVPARVTAASYIIDQYIGKATQPTREDPPAKDLGPLESLSLEQLEVLKRLMTRYTPEQIDRLMGLEKKQADSVGSEVERVQRGPGGMEAKRRG